MQNKQLLAFSQAQRDRLAFIELRTQFYGEISRQDLVSRFGIQVAAATRDIAGYKEIAPSNLAYDAKAKIYVRAEPFWPVFAFPVERILTWLSHGFGDNEPLRLRTPVVCEVPPQLNKPKLDTLAVLARAIHHNKAVEITYRALSSGSTTREIVPFAFADSGQRWHVRAYDRRGNEFRDFVLTRIADAQATESPVQDYEIAAQDIQWNRIVELELVPHPANIQHPDTIEAEYGMENGTLLVRVRAALAAYMLRRWNVDCTVDHRLKGTEYHLWLRNRQALYGASNLVLAPGYETPDAK